MVLLFSVASRSNGALAVAPEGATPSGSLRLRDLGAGDVMAVECSGAWNLLAELHREG